MPNADAPETLVVTAGETTVSITFPSAEDHLANEIRLTGDFYEAAMLEDIRRRVPDGGVFIDVGANVGNHAIFFATRCSAAKVFAFEPYPPTFSLLQSNISQNRLNEVIFPLAIAVGEMAGKGEVIMPREAGKLGMVKVSPHQAGTVEIQSLDTLLGPMLPQCDVIKIDVEGAELAVLRGAVHLLARFHPILYVEAADPISFAQVKAFLSTLGYCPTEVFNATPTYRFEMRSASTVHGKGEPDRHAEFSSSDYWDLRYRQGGNSGAGSYGQLAQFKADVLNEFIRTRQIGTAIEFGCGDGNQLQYMAPIHYLGVDVSPAALERCRKRFSGDSTKRFQLYVPGAYSEGKEAGADLALSLDVIYHLVEDSVFEAYMADLFAAGEKYVVVYSSDRTSSDGYSQHVRHRKFTEYVSAHFPQWKLVETVPNRFSVDAYGPENGSFADFFFYERT